jgi:hypothetical protein
MTRDAAGRPGFTCPDCGITSYHPEDVKHEYCGGCHRFTQDPLPLIVPGQGISPAHWRALDAYRRSRGLPAWREAAHGPAPTSAEACEAFTWWNRWHVGFAFPKIPTELRPLFVRVMDVVTEELREPGHRASAQEAMVRNRIRHVFEAGSGDDEDHDGAKERP